MHRDIEFIDTTFRDGVQSLWAMNLKTDDLKRVIPHMRFANFDQIEVMAPGGAFKKFVRHLSANPWDYIHALVDAVDVNQLRWHGRFQGYAISGTMHTDVGHLMIRRVVELGITKTRIGDNWNRVAVVKAEKETLEQLGMQSIVNLMYSVSDRHTDDYFVERAIGLAAFAPYRICFKDVGGLLTPDRARVLLPKIREATKAIPLEFHAHCNNGLAPINCLIAADNGFKYIHTSIPPLANGTSQPSIFNVTDNLEERGYRFRIDRESVRKVSARLSNVAESNGFPIGVPVEYSESMYQHQVPGGMISNLVHQLALVGKSHLMPQVLQESAAVRRDFGHPIMVTPLSQFVGSQAAINVITGQRYQQVSDDVIHYAWGRHGGEEAIAAMDPEVRHCILDRPRARELEFFEIPDFPLEYFRALYGPVEDEELILRSIVGNDAIDVIKARRQTPVTRTSVQTIMDVLQLASNNSRQPLGRLDVKWQGVSLTIRATSND